jgi:hypothetical protein
VLSMDFRSHPSAACGIGDAKPAGDALEELLTSYGFTKEWLVEVKEKFGLPPTCNCEARQKWINKVSAAHPTIANVGVKLLNALTRK